MQHNKNNWKVYVSAGWKIFNLSYYKKTTSWVPTKFCIMIKFSKCSLWEVSKCAQQIQGCHLENWKLVITLLLFDQFWLNMSWWCNWGLCTQMTVKTSNFWNLSPRWPASWKSKICNISAKFYLMFDEIARSDSFWAFLTCQLLKFWIFNNPR